MIVNGDENHDPNITVDLPPRGLNSTFTPKKLIDQSNASTIVQQISGERVKYTTKDMDVIRREARVDSANQKEELKEMEMICGQYEYIIGKLQEMQKVELGKKDLELSQAIDERDNLQEKCF